MEQLNNPKGDELSLKDLILTVREFWKELWKNWLLIGLITLPFVGLFIYKSLTTNPVFTAEIRFIVNGDSGGMGRLGGLLGNFGISRPGGTNPFRIVEVGRSKRIMADVLFSNIDQDTMLANKIIATYELDEKWTKKKPEFSNFRFTHTNLDSLDKLGRQGLSKLYKFTAGSAKNKSNALYRIGLNEEEGIFSIAAKTESEKVSLHLVEEAYDRIKYFFEEQTLEDQKKTRDLLKEKTDSIQGLINYKTMALARFEDENRGLILKQQKIAKEKLLLEIQGLTSAFTEAIKNFEFADYSYRDSKPLFMEIDRPIPPLDSESNSLIKSIIFGGLLGGIIGVLFVLIRKIIRDAMRN